MKIVSRLQKLRQKLAELELEAVLISQPEDRYYLSGFSGSAGYLLITAQKAVLATDFRYIEQGKQQAPGYDIFKISNDIKKWFPELAAGINKLGFESTDITFAAYRHLSETAGKMTPPLKLVPTEGLVEGLRAVKEPEEIELIRRAAAIADKALQYAEEFIRPGATELAVAWEIEKSMREQGSQAMPFEVIVASGPNAALPHARPSTRVIQAGEPVVIDIGAKAEGYASDMTRTVCAGTPGDTFKKVYDIVLGAQLTAIATIKEKMTGEQADSLARTIIAEAGYADNFGHGLGHGVGLAVHELPRLGPNSKDVLTSGMVFTIEPGVYLPGWGGVRIEDLILLEDGNLRLLTKSRKV